MIVVCTKCHEEMKRVILDNYEYVEGFPLYYVPAFRCEKCRNLFFTEETVALMENFTSSSP